MQFALEIKDMFVLFSVFVLKNWYFYCFQILDSNIVFNRFQSNFFCLVIVFSCLLYKCFHL